MTIMLSVALLGCSRRNMGPTLETPETGYQKEKQILTLMAVGGSNERAFEEVMKQAAARFNANNDYNAEIRLEWYENEQYKMKLATLMTQNDVTDIFFTWEAGFMKDYVESGRIYSLSEELEADQVWHERFYDDTFDAVTFDGEIYAMPMGRAVTPIYYNKDIFRRLHLEVPNTWNEFIHAVKTIKKGNLVPMAMVAQDAWIPAQLMLDISGGVGGKDLYKDTVQGTGRWDDPRYIKTGELMKQLLDAGAFAEGFLGMTYDEGRAMFTEGRAAMYPMGSWDTSAIIEAMGSPDSIGVFFLPAYDQKNSGVRFSCVEKVFAVSASCKNKKAAVAFLKELSGETTQSAYAMECGGLPATKLSVDRSEIDPVTQEIMKLQEQITVPLTAMDRQLGADLGGQFNNLSLAIAAGKNPAEQFAAMQAYAERIAE